MKRKQKLKILVLYYFTPLNLKTDKGSVELHLILIAQYFSLSNIDV